MRTIDRIRTHGPLVDNDRYFDNDGSPTAVRILVAFVVLALLAVVLITPLGGDNAVFQSMAFEWLHYGKLPYLGSWDQSFPAIIVLHAIPIALFGNWLTGFRVVDALLQVGIVYVYYSLWKHWLTQRAALTASLLYLAYYAHAGSTVMGQRDIFAIAAVACGWLVLVKKSTPASRANAALLSGLVMGVAFLFRPTYGLYSIAMFAILPQLHRPGSAIRFIAGNLAPIAVFVMSYALIPNALDAFVNATLRFNLDLYTQFNAPWSWFTRAFVANWFVVVPAVVGGGIAFFKGRGMHTTAFAPSLPERALYIAFVLLTVATIVWQHKFLSYHFAPLLVLLTPLAALSFVEVLPKRSTLYWLSSSIIVLFLGLPKGKLWQALTLANRDHESFHNVYDSLDFPDTLKGWAPIDRAVDYLAPARDRGERIEVFGLDARMRALLGANSATRFTQLHSVGYRTDTTLPPDQGHPSYQANWRKELVQSLAQNRPSYIAIVRTSDSWYLHDPYTDVLHHIQGFDTLLQRDYAHDTIFGGIEIYGRK